MKKQFQQYGVNILAIAVIIILGIRMLWNLMDYMDLLPADEAFYLYNGVHIFERVPKGWGPLYSAWYKFLHFFQHDLLLLHHQNFKVLAIGTAILFFVAFRRLKVNSVAAFVVSAFYLMSHINIITWPRISHFVVMGILAAFIIGTYIRSYYLKLLLFTFTALMISYARPEISLSFFAMALWTAGYVLYKKFRLGKAGYAATLVMLVVCGGLITKLGIPILSKSKAGVINTSTYTRQVTAFGQHYAMNYYNWHNMENEVIVNWQEAFTANFEPKPSFTETLKTNPVEARRHIVSNITNFFKFTFYFVAGIFFPDYLVGFPLWLKFVLTALVLIVLIRSLGLKNARAQAWAFIKEHHVALMAMVFICGPTWIACVLIYPRNHYILLQLPLYLLILTPMIMGSFDPDVKPVRATALILLIGVVLFFIIPREGRLDHFDLWQPREGPMNISAIQALDRLDIKDTITIMEDEGLITPFMKNQQFGMVLPFMTMQDVPFRKIMDSLNVKVVYVTSLLLKDPVLTRDPDWHEFLAHPEQAGFEHIPLSNPYGYLLVDRATLGL